VKLPFSCEKASDVHLFEMTKVVTLVHPRESVPVPYRLLVEKSKLFRDSPMLGGSPNALKWPHSLEDFRAFVSAVEGTAVPITNSNFKGLLQLSEEFGFGDLGVQLSQFRVSGDLKEEGTREDWEARKRISALEEQMEQRDQELAALRCELSRQAEAHGSVVEGLLGRVGRLEAEVTALHSTTET
jgi:hypothetical protein